MRPALDPVLALLDAPGTPDWDAVLAALLEAFDCTTGTIHLLSPTDGLLHLKAQRGIPDFLLPKMIAIPVGKGMAGIAAERNEPVQVCNLQTDESGVARPSARETKVEGSLAAPMTRDGRLYGVLGIAKPVYYEFSDEEIEAVMEIGRLLAGRVEGERA